MSDEKFITEEGMASGDIAIQATVVGDTQRRLPKKKKKIKRFREFLKGIEET
jgi:hypothetical protein